jgi:hypothetical protein
MAQKTAITWFWEQIPELLPFTVDTETAIGLLMAYQEAKAIEKKQIKKAFEEGGVQYMSNIGDDRPPKAEDYFNKTYQPNKVKTDK